MRHEKCKSFESIDQRLQLNDCKIIEQKEQLFADVDVYKVTVDRYKGIFVNWTICKMKDGHRCTK